MTEVRVRTRTRPAPEAAPAVRVRTRPAPKAQRIFGMVTTCGLCRPETSATGPVIAMTVKHGEQHVVYSYNGKGDIHDPANYGSPTRFDDHVSAGEFVWRKHNCPVESGATVAPKRRGRAKPAWATGHSAPRKRARKS